MKTNNKPKKGLSKYIKLHTLIVLIVLLAFNSYAWFIFATKVSGGLSAHVTSWDVTFQVGDEEDVTSVVIDVSQIYPGMETYEKTVIVKNVGETIADIYYEFKEFTIFGDTYKVGDGYTQEELDSKIANDYPFKIEVVVDNTELEALSGYGTFTISVNWPYESGDDEEDTYWGQRAYEYYQENPTETGLQLVIQLVAEQKKQNS